MEPTIALRSRLRKLLNEVIPAGGRDTYTSFTDSELDELLKEADRLYAAASAGWIEKAGLLQGEIESYTAGTEKYELTSLKDRLAHVIAMSKQYSDMAPDPNDVSSLMLRVQPRSDC